MKATKNQKRMEKLSKMTQELRSMMIELREAPMTRKSIIGLSCEFADLECQMKVFKDALGMKRWTAEDSDTFLREMHRNFGNEELAKSIRGETR
jgi:hypothetical protein